MKVHACADCQARLIVARGVPALNAGPDPAGSAAAQQTAGGTWLARFLAAGEQPVVPEKRYAVHECEGTRHKAQRDAWQGAVAGLHRDQRNRRGQRPGPQVTGYVRPADTLPGMGDTS